MKILLAIAIAAVSVPEIKAEATVTNAAELARFVYREQKTNVAFDISGTIPISKSVALTVSIYLADDSGGVIVFGQDKLRPVALQAGDRIRARGHTRPYDFGQVVALCESIEIIGHGPSPEPAPVSIEELRSGRFDCRYVKLCGTLRDAFDDEVDGSYTYLVLTCEGKLLYAPAPRFKVGDGMIGAEIEIAGIYDPKPGGGRRYMGPIVSVLSIDPKFGSWMTRIAV